MVKINNFSHWAGEVHLGEIYEEYNESENLLDQAYEAVSKFCRKEEKRSKISKSKRQCWQ